MSEAEHSLAAGVPSGLSTLPSLCFGHFAQPDPHAVSAPFEYRCAPPESDLHPQSCGFSGCAAPSTGFTGGTGRVYSPLAQRCGPRLRHSLLPAGGMGVGLTADGTPMGVTADPTTELADGVTSPVLRAIAGSSPKPPPPALARSLARPAIKMALGLQQSQRQRRNQQVTVKPLGKIIGD